MNTICCNKNDFYIDCVLLLRTEQYQMKVKVAINHKVFPVFDDLECLFFLVVNSKLCF